MSKGVSRNENLTDIPSYESIVLDDCLKEYSFENEITNPLTKFYIYSNTLDIMNSYNLKIFLVEINSY